jgi:hypothetical protein
MPDRSSVELRTRLANSVGGSAHGARTEWHDLVRAVAERLRCGSATAADRVDPSPDGHVLSPLVQQPDPPSNDQRPVRRDPDDPRLLGSAHELRFLAVAFPPLRPADFFWAVVPPWLVLWRRVPEPELFPPRDEAPGEFAIRAARAFDIPFSFRASYWSSFFTLGLLSGMMIPPPPRPVSIPFPDPCACIPVQRTCTSRSAPI